MFEILSLWGQNLSPLCSRNIDSMVVVKFLARLDLETKFLVFGWKLTIRVNLGQRFDEHRLEFPSRELVLVRFGLVDCLEEIVSDFQLRG